MEIPLFNTYIHPSAKEKVNSVLETTFLSEGKLAKEFEDRLASDLGLHNPVTLNSGTAALHIAMLLARIKPGDEVILPAQGYIATGLALLYVGATPVFADIQYETGNIDPTSLETRITPKTKAIVALHWGGNPCDLDAIHTIAKKHGLTVIEDAAHALGATYKGKAVGSISDFSCFSFQATKHLTTGDGGAVCMLNEQYIQRAKTLRWFGIDRVTAKTGFLGEREYNADTVGYKYHLNDYGAALGLANIQGFSDRITRRQQIANTYRNAFSKVSGISLFLAPDDRTSAHYLFGFHVENRDSFIKLLREKNIAVSVIHIGIDKNTIFGGRRIDLPNQRRFDETQIHIPMHDALTDEQISYIIDSVKKGW